MKRSSTCPSLWSPPLSIDTPAHKAQRKAPLAQIHDDRARAVTLLKRRTSLFKKAYELSMLCGCEIGIIMFHPNGKLFEFSSSGDMDGLLLRYASYSLPHEMKSNHDYTNESPTSSVHHDESVMYEQFQLTPQPSNVLNTPLMHSSLLAHALNDPVFPLPTNPLSAFTSPASSTNVLHTPLSTPIAHDSPLFSPKQHRHSLKLSIPPSIFPVATSPAQLMTAGPIRYRPHRSNSMGTPSFPTFLEPDPNSPASARSTEHGFHFFNSVHSSASENCSSRNPPLLLTASFDPKFAFDSFPAATPSSSSILPLPNHPPPHHNVDQRSFSSMFFPSFTHAPGK